MPKFSEDDRVYLAANDPSGLGVMVARITSRSRAPSLLTTVREGDLRVHFVNDSFLELSGCLRASVIETSLADLLANLLDRGSFIEVTAALSEGRAAEWRLPFRTANGSQFWAAVFVSPVLDGSAELALNVLSIIKVGDDGERFIERQDELNALYENAPGFIATSAGREHRITFANASYKKFVGVDDLVGRTVEEAMPSLVEQGILNLLNTVFDTGVPFVGVDVEMSFDSGSTHGGTARYCDFVYRPVFAADGSVAGLFCEGYDVTEKHLAAVALAQMQSEMIHLARANAMGTMAATLAHELNQPLTAIRTYADAATKYLTRCEDAATAHASEALSAIGDLAQRMGGIIKNLRDLTDRRQGHWCDFSLRDAVLECRLKVKTTTTKPCSAIEYRPNRC